MPGTQMLNVSFLFLWGLSKKKKNEKQERRGERLSWVMHVSFSCSNNAQ